MYLHPPARRVAGVDIGGDHESAGRRHFIKQAQQLFTNRVGQVIKQTGAIDQIVSLRSGFGGILEQLHHGFLDHLDSGAPFVLEFDLVERPASVLHRLVIEIQQREVSARRQRRMGHEPLHFERRPAAQVHHLDDSSAAGGAVCPRAAAYRRGIRCDSDGPPRAEFPGRKR